MRAGARGLEIHDVIAHRYNVPLRKGDVVLHVEGKPTPDFKAYWALIRPESGTAIAYAGDPVRVGVRRARDTLEFRFPLVPETFSGFDPKTVSRRWFGFPSVFSTDVQLTPKQCGAPVIDKSGRVVGIAIASRTIYGNFGQRHVIPARVARGVVAD